MNERDGVSEGVRSRVREKCRTREGVCEGERKSVRQSVHVVFNFLNVCQTFYLVGRQMLK